MRRVLLGSLLLLALRANASAAENKVYTAKKTATGLELIGMESHKVPLVTIVLASKAGAMTESPESNGLTHLWEHMFFKGNKRLPNQEAFNKRIRQLGITYNGDTSAEKVRYYFTLPSAFLEEGIQFMADAISTPLLDEEEMKRERKVVVDEYDRAAGQPGFDFHNLQRNYIYGDAGYLRDPLGLRPTILATTREQLFKIRDEVFVPSNSSLLVAGDFKPENLDALVKKYFSDWKDPKDWKAKTPPPFPAFPASASFVMTRPDVQNAQVSISMAGPKARSQPADSFAADVLINLLEHRSGKFYKKFVDSGLTYQTGLSYYTQSQAGEIELFATTEPKKATQVENLLLVEIKEWMKTDYFSASQLEDTRRKLLINHKRELNQPTAYIKSLAFWWAVTGLDYYDHYLENLRKTGLAEVRSFVKKWMLDKPHLSGILVSPQDAQAAGLQDNSAPLVEKYLAMYKKEAAP